MLKRIIIIAICALSLLSLTGCERDFPDTGKIKGNVISIHEPGFWQPNWELQFKNSSDNWISNYKIEDTNTIPQLWGYATNFTDVVLSYRTEKHLIKTPAYPLFLGECTMFVGPGVREEKERIVESVKE